MEKSKTLSSNQQIANDMKKVVDIISNGLGFFITILFMVGIIFCLIVSVVYLATNGFGEVASVGYVLLKLIVLFLIFGFVFGFLSFLFKYQEEQKKRFIERRTALKEELINEIKEEMKNGRLNNSKR